MALIDGDNFNYAAAKSTKGLTRVMVLHPVACALAFLAFLSALGSGVCGALFASLISAVAWIVTVVVMAIDFTIFGIIKNHVNKDGTGNKAKYSVGMWTILAAMILLFFATFIVLFTCFSARRHKNDNVISKHGDAGYANGTTVHKRRFWQRKSAY
jgi:Na+/serine symporter